MSVLGLVTKQTRKGAATEREDRRGAERLMTIFKVVRVRRDDDEGLARCRNISNKGAKLDVSMHLQVGDRVEIAFSMALLPARVVWVRGHECGVAFEHEIDCAELLGRPSASAPKGTRCSPRIEADIPAKIWAEGETITARVSNISQRGMKLCHDGCFEAGLRVTITLPGGWAKTGVIRWVKNNHAGVLLLDPFSVEELGSVHAL